MRSNSDEPCLACFSLAGAAAFSAALTHTDAASSIDVLTMTNLVFMRFILLLLLIVNDSVCSGSVRLQVECYVHQGYDERAK